MEIEKEVKKMALGHEFGAGAACLKCKDKCEGFELHFWRKICRNCKCGLTEHDVSMNSEENKKVGKLFEDTKYTGLIAKLKTDGIPRYQDNMVTITLPAPATAYTMPPSASSTVVQPSAAAGSAQPAGAGAGSAQPAGAGAGSAQPAGAGAGSAQPAGAGAGSAQRAGAGAGSAQPAGAAAGSTVISPSAWAQGRPQVQPAPVSVTPVKANKVPIAASVTAASVVPVPKDVPMKSVTYEWAPPVSNKYLAVRYIELLPPEKRPVAGTEGAAYRRQQMACQLPEHDQDPSMCHELSPAEVKLMQQYVRKYKDEALGVGDVMLPEEMAQVQAGRQGGAVVGAGDTPGAGGSGFGPGAGVAAGAAGAAGAGSGPGLTGPGVGVGGGFGPAAGGAGAVRAGPLSGPGTGQSGGFGPAEGAMATAATAGAMSAGLPPRNFSCHHCQQPMGLGEPAVYAERAGYDKLWHPACFVCCTCSELLVDMIYFWKKGKMYCGRHYGDSEKPRCAGCDELIFSNEYTQAEGQNWHLKHFCCFECDCILAGETYVMEKDKPVCTPCYMKNYAVKCSACQNPVEPEAQRVSYGEHHWHAEPHCFKCSGCTKCLIGQRFMAVQKFLFCSVECKKKVMA
ncbi:testin [Odontesthes bonariensis]|uniref:testin n=1 Tax=Odontesthes bonariensis TaxID=219752 RepID=UPI003F58A7A3